MKKLNLDSLIKRVKKFSALMLSPLPPFKKYIEDHDLYPDINDLTFAAILLLVGAIILMSL